MKQKMIEKFEFLYNGSEINRPMRNYIDAQIKAYPKLLQKFHNCRENYVFMLYNRIKGDKPVFELFVSTELHHTSFGSTLNYSNVRYVLAPIVIPVIDEK